MVRRGVNQRTLAESSGLSEPYLSKRLNALYVFTVVDVEQIAGALDMSPDALMLEAVREMEREP